MLKVIVDIIFQRQKVPQMGSLETYEELWNIFTHEIVRRFFSNYYFLIDYTDDRCPILNLPC